MQVYLKSVHSFKRYSADKPFSNNLSPSVTLEMGVKVSSFPCHNNIDVKVRSKSIHSFRRQGADKPFIAVQVWSKSTHSFRRQGADKLFSTNLSLSVTLKMGSRSTKSNQFFSMSQQLRCRSLVKIHSSFKR